MGSRTQGLSSCHLRAYLPYGIWDLSSLTMDWTPILCSGRQILSHWTTWEVPICTDLISTIQKQEGVRGKVATMCDSFLEVVGPEVGLEGWGVCLLWREGHPGSPLGQRCFVQVHLAQPSPEFCWALKSVWFQEEREHRWWAVVKGAGAPGPSQLPTVTQAWNWRTALGMCVPHSAPGGFPVYPVSAVTWNIQVSVEQELWAAKEKM